MKIYGTGAQVTKIKQLLNKYKNEIYNRNIKVLYYNAPMFRAELIGYDGQLKKTVENPSEIIKFFDIIDEMPMGKIEKNMRESFANRDELLERCGLPNTNSTSHCFNDNTHHTCCMLGPKAREYADNSGNPIGITSENAFELRYGRKPTQDDKTSWCTCLGSKVCSYYQNKFNDGTHIKFIGNLDTKNEDDAITKMGIGRHKTPGVQ